MSLLEVLTLLLIFGFGVFVVFNSNVLAKKILESRSDFRKLKQEMSELQTGFHNLNRDVINLRINTLEIKNGDYVQLSGGVLGFVKTVHFFQDDTIEYAVETPKGMFYIQDLTTIKKLKCKGVTK